MTAQEREFLIALKVKYMNTFLKVLLFNYIIAEDHKLIHVTCKFLSKFLSR